MPPEFDANFSTVQSQPHQQRCVVENFKLLMQIPDDAFFQLTYIIALFYNTSRDVFRASISRLIRCVTQTLYICAVSEFKIAIILSPMWVFVSEYFVQRIRTLFKLRKYMDDPK